MTDSTSETKRSTPGPLRVEYVSMMGESLNQFIQRVRIEKAATLLGAPCARVPSGVRGLGTRYSGGCGDAFRSWRCLWRRLRLCLPILR